MIVFDLKCRPVGHVFEAWFGSSEDFDSQAGRGLVACPICGTLRVEKAVMAPRIGGGSSETTSGGPEQDAIGNARAKAMLSAMAEMQTEMLRRSHYVGERFADEARAIYLGEADARSIYGKATADETARLRDEGIEIAPLPFPIVPPGEEN